MKKMFALLAILLSAEFVLASDTPNPRPFPHGDYAAFAAHRHPAYGHPMRHQPAMHDRTADATLRVCITIPDLSSADAEMEANSRLDMTKISLPSFEQADREMNPLDDIRISVAGNYQVADAEMALR